MKKMLSLILALILCLTAVSAFAEAAPVSPTLIAAAEKLAESVAVPEALEEVLTVNDEANEEATSAFVEEVLGEIVEDIDAFYADVIETSGNESLELVATVPMTFAATGDLGVDIVDVTSAIPENLPDETDDIKAVYSYKDAEGNIKSVEVGFVVDAEHNTITYAFPADVVADATVGTVNFLKVVAEEA